MDFNTQTSGIFDCNDDTLDMLFPENFDEMQDEILPPIRPKTEESAEIAKLTKEFLARGGEIQYIPYDPTEELIAQNLEYGVPDDVLREIGGF
jgi:hypothetical protein